MKITGQAEQWFWGIRELFKPGGWIDRAEKPCKDSDSWLERCAANVTQTVLTDKKVSIREVIKKYARQRAFGVST